MSDLLDESIPLPNASAPVAGDDPGQNPRDPSSKLWSEEWEKSYAEPQLWEVAPTTDEEWDEALKGYALDRYSEVALSSPPPQTTVHRGHPQDPLVPLAHGQDPLIHRSESYEENNQPTPSAGETPRCESLLQPSQEPPRRFSWSPSEPGSNPQSPAVEEGSDWHWPPPRQPDSFTIVGGERGPLLSGPSTATHKTRRSSHPTTTSDPIQSAQYAHRLSELIGLPRQADLEEECGNSAEAERRAMRAAYEEKGWLPASAPSRSTRIRRVIALRRLGLMGEDDDSVRFSVMAKYTDLLCMIFGVTMAGVSILRGDEESIYLSHSNKRHWNFPAAEALASHGIQSLEWRCWVCKDMDKDWRFKNCPARIPGGNPIFVATAPLRYHLSDGNTVDFGILFIAAPKTREFGLRDQAVLLRISNMLVFQLATVQSEIMAKQSSAMYESSINFLRRSFVPERLKPSQQPSKSAEKKKADKKRLHQTHARHHKHGQHGTLGLHSPVPPTRPQSRSPSSMLSRPQSQVPSPISTPPPPTRVTKTGPLDAKRIKRRDMETEAHLFSDAAQTLRGILQADAVSIIDLREFQLFVRKTAGPHNQTVESKETIVTDFLQGKAWPSNVEPVVNFVPRYTSQGVQILGQSNSPEQNFDFSSLLAPDVMRNFIKTYLVTRQHWWDRDDESELAQQIMMFMPSEGKTVLATFFMTYTGALRFATFGVWCRPPCTFDDSSRLALPFVWIIGATLMSSLAIHRMWAIEESQITYSNLQAHELRTPLHQILAVTQLLRSGLSDFAETPVANRDCGLATMQQARDLLPLLDDIDTSGTTLHGIVENILTFLDLSANDYRWGGGGGMTNSTQGNRTGVLKTLGAMLEELIHEAYDEDQRGRIGSGQQLGDIETIFEIIPRDLGELVTEDFGGALRRALARVIHNAYRYIDVQGCVEIYVDDVKSMLPPEGCEDLANTRRIAITVTDNGRGMSSDFVREHLGEPWAKEDLYATGSGLSVHLAYRIIDLMNGEMEITSAPGQGCSVSIEVPLPVSRTPPAPSPIVSGRKVALVGFGQDVNPTCTNTTGLATSLQSQYRKLGCEIVDPKDADLVIVNGRLAGDPGCADALAGITAPDVAILVSTTDDDNLVSLISGHSRRVRRFLKPVTPSMVRRTLEEAPPSVPETPTDGCDIGQPRLRPHYDDAPIASHDAKRPTPENCMEWKPRGVGVEKAVASLSLSDYISSRNRLMRANSNGSNGSTPMSPETPLDQPPYSSFAETPVESDLRWTVPLELPMTTVSEDAEADTVVDSADLVTLDTPSPAKLTVLVVEDNIINRKILVRTLKATLPHLEILEAEDGVNAVDRFRNLGAPVIVLLDINMPRMDGYATAVEMRRIEKLRAAEAAGGLPPGTALGTITPAVRSKIIAITALNGEDDRHRGLVECGMDGWVTKPCAKSTLQKVVDEARQELAYVAG